MSLSPSNPPTPQALTPIISPPLLPQTSSSSASSIISRQSSCRSTTSVQAVPFKNPIRGPLTVNPRAESGMVVPPLPTGAADLGMKRTGSLGAGAAGGGGSYFSGAPIMRRGSDNNDNGGNSGYPSGFTTLHPVNSNGSSSVGLGVGAPTSLWNRQAIGKDSQKERERDEEELLGRPEVLRNGSSTLSSKPAKVRIGDAGETVLVIRKTAADYVFGDILGEGSYSTVYQVTDRQPPHRSYALKVLDKEHIKREKKIKYVLIERDTLKMLDGHPGIVRLYWTFQDARSLYYVLELAKNGELLKWIKKFGSFSLPSARYYAAQILSAVEHMHSKNVIHRDLKPENILLDEHMRVKVTDFGTAKLLPEVPTPVLGEPPRQRSRSFVGTPEYVSPEILSEKKESSKSSDYWGFGCILFQLLAGRPPFQAKTEYLMFQKIIKLEYEFPDGFPSDARDLVERLLVLDPLERLGGGELGITAIKSHPFFSSTDFSTIWTVTPPVIETGITEPKKEEYGEFVMPEGLDGFVSEEEESAEGGEGDEEVGAGRDGKDEQGVVASGLIVGIPKEAVTKWTGILLPSETILFASPILDRSGFLTKKRTLILTDYPRLICIKETPLKVTLKTEIFVGTKGVGGGSLIFSKADEGEGDRLFSVKTTQRTFKYEEPSGGAARWVSELREAQEKGLGLTTPAANGK